MKEYITYNEVFECCVECYTDVLLAGNNYTLREFYKNAYHGMTSILYNFVDIDVIHFEKAWMEKITELENEVIEKAHKRYENIKK